MDLIFQDDGKLLLLLDIQSDDLEHALASDNGDKITKKARPDQPIDGGGVQNRSRKDVVYFLSGPAIGFLVLQLLVEVLIYFPEN
jgi:hypothetical protein